MIIEDLLEELRAPALAGDPEAYAAKVAEIAGLIDAGSVTTEKQRRTLLTAVRGQRAFAALSRLCEALIWAGHDRPTLAHKPGPGNPAVMIPNPNYDPRVRQEMIQAMIDQGQLIPALDVIDQHRRNIEALGDGDGPPRERKYADAWGQAVGLAGRVHKQLYVDNALRHGARNVADHLRHAITAYAAPFRRTPGDTIRCDDTRDDEWHAINFVALLRRAEADNIEIPGESARTRASELARALTAKIEAAKKAGSTAGAWTYASLGEASVALGDWPAALAAYEAYAAHPGADKFALFGSLRQLIEVWELYGSEGDGAAAKVITALSHGLARRAGSDIESADLISIEEYVDDDGRRMTRLLLTDPDTQRQQVLQSSNLQSVQAVGESIGALTGHTIVTAAGVVSAVGRVINAVTRETVGTGFLLDGGSLLPDLAGRLVFLTNWHVVSDAATSGLHRRNARIRFDLAPNPDIRLIDFTVERILWESPASNLDAAILLLNGSLAGLGALKVAGDDFLPERLEDLHRTERRCTVIGFGGSDQSYVIGGRQSLQILDIGRRAEDPAAPVFVHYSNQTRRGDSGGPVCNAEWHVIALHHAGATESKIKPLSPNRHQGNVAEGIAMKSIAAAVRREADRVRAKLGDVAKPAAAETVVSASEAWTALEQRLESGDVADAAAIDRLIQSAIEAVPQESAVVAASDGGAGDASDEPAAPPMGPLVASRDVAQRSARGELGSGIAVVLSKINRSVRNTLFTQRSSAHDTARRLVTDGDSWFQYPLPYVDDVIDQLINAHGYLVNCGAIAGETLESRLHDTDVAIRADRYQADAVLLSGGGNDMLGYGAIVTVLRPYKDGMRAEDIINPAALDKKIDLLVEHFRSWIQGIRDYNATIPVFTHGYDWAIPKRGGPWLDRPMSSSRYAIRDRELQRLAVRHIIDRYCERMQAMTREMGPNVHFVDCRNAVGKGAHWMDELHPNNDGFARVATRFHQAIEKVLGPVKPTGA